MNNNMLSSSLSCTQCGGIILAAKDLRKHQTLGVVQCSACHTYYKQVGDLSQYRGGVDINGQDNYCRWCLNGGDLIMCADDFCRNTFCRNCILRNLGESACRRIENSEDWHCFLCEYSQLDNLRERIQPRSTQPLRAKGQTGSSNEPQTRIKPLASPLSQPKPQPNSKPLAQPEHQTGSQAAQELEQSFDCQPEVLVEVQPEPPTKPQPKIQANSQSGTQTRAQPEPPTKPQPKIQANSQLGTQTRAQPEPPTKPQPKIQANSQSGTQTRAQPEPPTKPQPKIQANSQSGTLTRAQPEPPTKPQSESPSLSQSQPLSQSNKDTLTGHPRQLESESQPELGTAAQQSQPQIQSESRSQQEPGSESISTQPQLRSLPVQEPSMHFRPNSESSQGNQASVGPPKDAVEQVQPQSLPQSGGSQLPANTAQGCQSAPRQVRKDATKERKIPSNFGLFQSKFCARPAKIIQPAKGSEKTDRPPDDAPEKTLNPSKDSTTTVRDDEPMEDISREKVGLGEESVFEPTKKKQRASGATRAGLDLKSLEEELYLSGDDSDAEIMAALAKSNGDDDEPMVIDIIPEESSSTTVQTVQKVVNPAVEWAINDATILRDRLQTHIKALQSTLDTFDENRFRVSSDNLFSWASNLDAFLESSGIIKDRCTHLFNYRQYIKK